MTSAFYRAAFRRRDGRLVSRRARTMRLLASTAAPTNSAKALGAFGAAALHATTAHQHRDSSLDTGAKSLALPERCRSFVGLALRRFATAALGNAFRLDRA